MEITKDFLLYIISEQNGNLPILKTTGNKPIVDAIKNRKKITFYYSGPRKPKKDSVKPGYRVKVEPVALGLSKKGNLIVRGWTDVPSTTKTGFAKGNWRTFILSRANNIQITDEVFNEKRPGYNDNGDGSMSVVYVKTDWTKSNAPKKELKPKEVPISKEKEPAKVEPKTTELPQPKPEVKPDPTPQDTTNQDIANKQKELYKKKESDWIAKQKEIGGNIKPGQGTRERFRKEVEKELTQPKPEVKPEPAPQPQPEVKPEPAPKPEEDKNDNTDNQLQESIKRIKSLMFL